MSLGFLVWAVVALGVAMGFAVIGLAIYLHRQSTLHEQVDICLPIEVVIVDPDEEDDEEERRQLSFAFSGKPKEL